MLSPITIATLQAATLSALANIAAQFLTAYRKDGNLQLSISDLIRFVITALVTAPPNYLWQAWLEQAFPGRMPFSQNVALEMVERGAVDDTASSNTWNRSNSGPTGERGSLSWRNTALKWFLDCIVLGALGNTIAFLLLMGLMKGKTLREVGSSIRTETFPIIFASYKFWPAASIINFTLISVENRVLFLSACGLCWGVYMSFVAEAV